MPTQNQSACTHQPRNEYSHNHGHDRTEAQQCTVGKEETDDATSTGCVHTHLPKAVQNSAADLYERGNDDYIQNESIGMESVQNPYEHYIAQQVYGVGYEALVALEKPLRMDAKELGVEIGEQSGKKDRENCRKAHDKDNTRQLHILQKRSKEQYTKRHHGIIDRMEHI